MGKSRVDIADPKTTLFVYGSLCDTFRREQIIGRWVATAAATMVDHERRRARYFYVRPSPGSTVAGLLLLELTAGDFAALDRYEQVPSLYTREKIEVLDADGRVVHCWAYLPSRAALDGRK